MLHEWNQDLWLQWNESCVRAVEGYIDPGLSSGLDWSDISAYMLPKIRIKSGVGKGPWRPLIHQALLSMSTEAFGSEDDCQSVATYLTCTLESMLHTEL